MLLKNLKLAIRHLKKDKVNTAINILGLTLGLSIVTVVTVFLINELGYNSSVTKRDRIYRVLNNDDISQKISTSTPFILGEMAKEQIAGIEEFTHTSFRFSIDVKKDDDFIKQTDVTCLDGAFFDMFSVKILQGKLTDDFDKSSNQAFISKSLAKKYFGMQDVVGKELIVKYNNKEKAMQIAGVFDDIPNNSTIKAQMIFNMNFAFDKMMANNISFGDFDLKAYYYSWEGQLSCNYFLLKENTDVQEIEQQLAELGKANSDENNKLSFSLQPLNKVYFHSKEIRDNMNVDKGNLNMVYMLAVVGLLILLIACVNYLNLSSAQAFSRAKNMSVNQVFGATRSGVIWQMITESVLVALVALPFALLIAYYTLPYLSDFLGHQYPLRLTENAVLAIVSLMAITVFVGMLAGGLVAIKITSFKLTETIKGKNMFIGEKFLTRKASIVFQFAVFIVLLVVVFGINKQIDYVMNTDMGFTKEGLVKIEKGDRNYETFRQEILKNPNILSVSGALWLPPSNNTMNMSLTFPEGEFRFRGNQVDYDFVKTMGLKLLKGEDFERGKHNSGVIISESASKLMKKKDEELIGKELGDFGQIIGIISDFNMSSLHDKASPMFLMLQPSSCGEIAVRINTANLKETIDFLEQEYNKLEGSEPFSYQFADDVLAKMYESDSLFSQLIAFLAFIAIFIAGLGLFGLSVLINKRRTKEIGIRKINGATIKEVLVLLNKEFLWTVAIAFVIATPIAYYAMNKWLENFAYKTTLSWWIFALAGLSAFVIALLTVSWQSYKAASRNPVEALRYE